MNPSIQNHPSPAKKRRKKNKYHPELIEEKIIKIRPKINETDSLKHKRLMKQFLFFEKINRTYKPLATLRKDKRRLKKKNQR
jgi:hypothetical protein